MRLLAAIAVLIALSFALQSPTPTPTPRKSSHKEEQVTGEKAQKANHYHDNSEQSPSTVDAPKSPQTEKVTSDSGHQKSEKTTSDKWITWFTGVLAFVAVLQFVALVTQAHYMRKALEETKKSADAASKNADALVSAERAWVLASLSYPKRAHTVKDHVLSFTNHGQTPAQIASYCWNLKILNSLADLPPEPKYEREVLITSRLLAPSEYWEVATIMPIPNQISGETWKEIHANTKIIACWGYVEYKGIFQGVRCTNFGYVYDSYSGSYAGGLHTGGFVVGNFPAKYNEYA